jgi:hypothetical protein
MLHPAILGCPASLRTCLAFVNAMLAFTISSGYSLEKQEGSFERPHRRSIQPIVIFESWLRLAAIVCMWLLYNAGPSLASLLLGVGIEGGAANIGHFINSAIHSDPDNTVLVCNDWVDAYNTI